MHGDAGSKWGATWDERGDVAARVGSHTGWTFEVTQWPWLVGWDKEWTVWMQVVTGIMDKGADNCRTQYGVEAETVTQSRGGSIEAVNVYRSLEMVIREETWKRVVMVCGTSHGSLMETIDGP